MAGDRLGLTTIHCEDDDLRAVFGFSNNIPDGFAGTDQENGMTASQEQVENPLSDDLDRLQLNTGLEEGEGGDIVTGPSTPYLNITQNESSSCKGS